MKQEHSYDFIEIKDSTPFSISFQGLAVAEDGNDFNEWLGKQIQPAFAAGKPLEIHMERAEYIASPILRSLIHWARNLHDEGVPVEVFFNPESHWQTSIMSSARIFETDSPPLKFAAIEPSRK